MIGALPEALTVGDEEYPIRTDYRNVLQVFEAFQDPELQPEEKWIVAIYLLFENFSCDDDVLEAAQDGFDLGEAMKQISWFISAGQPEKQVLEQPTYNWTQDEQMIFSAVNKVAGRETRELEYLHWWTFLGYFNEVGEGTFSFIVGIRHKLNKGKKLEKHEKEFLSLNKELVLMKKPLTKEEQEQEDAYKSLLDEVLG
ncbi:MAG: hypothetical protein HFI03_14390 [Lachnospiraceae bacterium]|jgi:hypothetical protein|nr:hypothetical protein [Lachnospiraceae bacterium]